MKHSERCTYNTEKVINFFFQFRKIDFIKIIQLITHYMKYDVVPYVKIKFKSRKKSLKMLKVKSKQKIYVSCCERSFFKI